MDSEYPDLRSRYRTPFVIDSDPKNSKLVESILQAADFSLEEPSKIRYLFSCGSASDF